MGGKVGVSRSIDFPAAPKTKTIALFDSHFLNTFPANAPNTGAGPQKKLTEPEALTVKQLSSSNYGA